MENLGAQTTKAPSRQSAEESYWTMNRSGATQHTRPEQKPSLELGANFSGTGTTPTASWETSIQVCMTTCERPVRIRYPTGKIYWDPATAHRGHREQGIIWQCYQQGAAPPVLPEVGQHLDKTLHLVHNYSL
jgi:hypothetical protein